MEEREPFYIDGNVNWCSHYREQYFYLQKVKIESLYHPAIPLLGIYPDKTAFQKDTYTAMFTAAPSAIAKTWRQPKCLVTEEWTKKMGYIYMIE